MGCRMLGFAIEASIITCIILLGFHTIYIYIYINSIIYPLEACSTYSDPNIRTIRVSAESREILHKRFLQHSPLVSQEPPRTLVDLFV